MKTSPLRGKTPDLQRKAVMHNPTSSVKNVNGSSADYQPSRSKSARPYNKSSKLKKPLGDK